MEVPVFGSEKITIGLAGNANVGKSVIFNQLTGLHQHVGNWPGKTIERAEGTLVFEGKEIEIIDLPGIYSLSTYSIEELVSREYIAVEQPDVLINVVDAGTLERNLAFTVQLMELEPRLVLAVNQIDVAENKGIIIDTEELSKQLGVPALPTVAVKGTGLTGLVATAVKAVGEAPSTSMLYGSEIEESIESIKGKIKVQTPYPARWVAIKLLERDEEIEGIIYDAHPELREVVEQERFRLESAHGHDFGSVIASERFALAHRIADKATRHIEPQKSIGKRI